MVVPLFKWFDLSSIDKLEYNESAIWIFYSKGLELSLGLLIYI